MFSKDDIEKYFMGEKQAGLLFMIIALAVLVTAILFFFMMKPVVFRGAAWPLALAGLLFGIIGYTVYKRSDEDRIRNVYAYDMNPPELKQKELPRMEKVMRNFVVYRYAELFLLLVGLALYIYFIRDFRQDWWRGLGLGLVVIALLALTADYFAESRGKKYINGLRAFVKNQ